MNESFYVEIIKNLGKIMDDRNLNQARMAEYAGTSPSQFSKILKFQVNLSFSQLSNIATNLQMSELDIITYPVHMVPAEGSDGRPEEIQVLLRLNRHDQDQILKILYGNHDLEIISR